MLLQYAPALAKRTRSVASGYPALPTSTPSANWVTRYSQDFEDNSLTAVQAIGSPTPSWNRANVTSPVITGSRSYNLSVTDWAAGYAVDATWDWSTWINTSARDVKRFRATVKARAHTTTTTIFVGVRQILTPFAYQEFSQVAVTTTPTTFTFDFLWSYDGDGQLRVGLTEVSSIIIDDVLLEEDTNFTGFLPADTGLIPADFYGMHFNQAHVGGHLNGPDLDYKLVRAFGLGTHRFAQTTEGGAINYSYIDSNATECLNHGANYMHQCAWLPEWATDGEVVGSPPYPGSNLLPDAGHLDDVLSFITAARTRVNGIASGKFKYVELWNEADQAQFFAGSTVAEMVAFCEAVYDHVKTLDSTITVIAPNIGGYGLRWMDLLLSAGIDDFCDAYSLHAYPALAGYRGQISAAYNFRKVLNRHGVSTSKPIYNTEASPGDNTAGVLARAVASAAMAGLKQYIEYTLEGSYGTNTQLASASTYETNTALGNELNAVCSWLANHTITAAYADPTLGTFHMVMDRPAAAGTRVVGWTSGATVSARGSSGWGITTSHTLTGSTGSVPTSGGAPVLTLGPAPVMFDNGA